MPMTAPNRSPFRRLVAALALTAAALLTAAASAQAIGDDVATFLDATGAVATADGPSDHRLGGLALSTRAPADVLATVTLRGALDEQGVADAAAALAIATGYGAGIEEPLASFLRERADDFAGEGPVRIAVEAYALELDLAEVEPLSGSLTLSLPRVDEAAFGEPVAVLGDPDAPVVVRTFSDFQCPACRRYATQVLPGLEEGLLASGEVRVAFHHLPLDSIHANAVPAAEAAQCVADGFGEAAFWAYHDLLFERQAAWQGLGDPEPYFGRLILDVDEELLTSAGAPVADATDPADAARDALAACIEAGDARDTVAAARQRAAALRLSSTPTVFVGGHRLEQFGTPAAYARLVRLERAIASAGGE